MSAPVARLHHYVPQGYLGAFTNLGNREGRLYAFDRRTGQVFGTRPRNVAAAKDFNRFETDTHPPDIVERGLSDLESRAAEVMRKMAKDSTLAQPTDLVYVINLIALLVVRNPRARRGLERAKQQVARSIGKLLVSGKKLYERQLQEARESGYVSGPDISFERMKAFVEGGRYTIEVSRESLIRTELSVFDGVLHCIGSRYWSLLASTLEAPDFVTCDHPVTLEYKDPTRTGPIGVGLKQTEIVFPIGPRHALRGVFEDPFKPVVTIKPRGVAAMNTRLLLNADRHVFARERRFVVLKDGRELVVAA